MKSRHRAREVALQILYRYDVAHPSSTSASTASATDAPARPSIRVSPVTPKAPAAPVTPPTPAPAIPQGTALLNDLVRHFDHFDTPQGLREFASQLVAGTLTHLAELDSILEQHVANWRVARLGFIDRSLLRMAAYELRYIKDTPPSVVIDEAIELGKEFGTEETPSFVNGVLDALKKHLSTP